MKVNPEGALHIYLQYPFDMYVPIRIIIADDHEIFRDGFKLLLKKQDEIELVAEAGNGKDLVSLVDVHQPDVVITDIQMPVMDGIEATKIITEKYPALGVIALTMFNEDSLIVDMLEAGARGYLLKNTNKEELVKATKTVYDGGAYFCNATNLKLANIVSKGKHEAFHNADEVKFTSRELEVIRLICEENTTKEIASKLDISVRTVDGYKENILEKIGAKNIVGIAVYDLKHKLLD